MMGVDGIADPIIPTSWSNFEWDESIDGPEPVGYWVST